MLGTITEPHFSPRGDFEIESATMESRLVSSSEIHLSTGIKGMNQHTRLVLFCFFCYRVLLWSQGWPGTCDPSCLIPSEYEGCKLHHTQLLEF